LDLVGFFGQAWALYKRNLGWLIVAGIIAGAISGAVVLIFVAIGGAVGYSAFGAFSGNGGVGGTSLVGALGGMLAAGAFGFLVAQLLVLVLQGGMLTMAIGSGRSGRSAELGELFAGFRHVPAYLVFGLIVQFAVPACCLFVLAVVVRLAGPAVLLATPACLAFVIWLYVGWLYAVPLIADRGLGPIEALGRSREMVSRVGWWSTFALLFVLAVVVWVISLVLSLLVGRAGLGGTPVMGVAEILIMPFAVCYLACMYLNSESRQAALSHGSPPGSGLDPYGSWPSSPAPFDPTMGTHAAPAGPAGGYGAPAGPAGGYVQPPPMATPGPPDKGAEAAAWASAADPLAQRPPATDGPTAAPARAPGAPDPSWLSE
jgi:hypothetical protein